MNGILEPVAHGFLLALASGVHCAGMCGIFALRAAAVTGGSPKVLSGLLIYGAGKTLTYMFLGALVGEAGRRIGTLAPEARSVLAAVFAVFLLVSAWRLLMGRGTTDRFGAALARWIAPLTRHLPRGHDGLGRFSLGVVNGALPCGVTSLALLDGAATGSVGSSVLLMAALGVGTLPALIVVGMIGRHLAAGHRVRVLRIVGGVVLLGLALFTLYGALGPLWFPPEAPRACCH